MSNDLPLPIDPNQRIDPVSAPRPASPAGTDQRFAELLEALQRLRGSGERSGGEGDAVRELDRQFGEADRLHETAMDLKRSLEEAYRRAIGG